jgi:very-short-patch-repair endonuclease
MAEDYNDNLHKGATGRLYRYGRELRHSGTKEEKLLWEHLRGRKLGGLKFRRQHPFDKFMADFYCHEKKLIIELDGTVHDEKMNSQYDEARTYQLAGLGIKVIRLRNYEVQLHIEFVLMKILEKAG